MCQNLSIIIATPPQSDQPQPDIPFTDTLSTEYSVYENVTITSVFRNVGSFFSPFILGVVKYKMFH